MCYSLGTASFDLLGSSAEQECKAFSGICVCAQVASSVIPAQESRVDNQGADASPLAACNAAALDAVP